MTLPKLFGWKGHAVLTRHHLLYVPPHNKVDPPRPPSPNQNFDPHDLESIVNFESKAITCNSTVLGLVGWMSQAKQKMCDLQIRSVFGHDVGTCKTDQERHITMCFFYWFTSQLVGTKLQLFSVQTLGRQQPTSFDVHLQKKFVHVHVLHRCSSKHLNKHTMFDTNVK